MRLKVLLLHAAAVVADVEGVALLLALAEELHGLAAAGGLARVVDEVYHERLEEVGLYPHLARLPAHVERHAVGGEARHRDGGDLADEVGRVEAAPLDALLAGDDELHELEREASSRLPSEKM